ncbi:MAG: YjfB family protein [Candidatus Sericytochromatia bacterium]
MNIDRLAGMTSTADPVATLILKKGLDQQANHMAQLLQALPPAPQPAHLGSGIDTYA